MGHMASFLSNTGATTGPAGVVHSVNLSEYGIWQGPLKDDDRAKLLINMHDYFFPTKADRKRAIKEIINKRYFADKRAYVATPRRVFKHLRKEHADTLYHVVPNPIFGRTGLTVPFIPATVTPPTYRARPRLALVARPKPSEIFGLRHYHPPST